MKVNCLVVGVVCNVENSIHEDVAVITSALRRFDGKIGWFLVESDSHDNSTKILEQIALSNANFNFKSLGKLSEKIPSRTERLAYARNEYLNELNKNILFKDLDYVVVCDFNNLNSQLTDSAVDSCFHRQDWDACFANPNGPYYDIWALRHELWSPNDCWKQLDFLRRFNVFPEKALYAAVHSRMVKISQETEWIKVESAFGGFGIYKAKALRDVSYRGIEPDGSSICEHVPLNEAINRIGGNLFINPRLINCGYVDHTIHKLFYRRVFRYIKYPIKSIKSRFANEKKIT